MVVTLCSLVISTSPVPSPGHVVLEQSSTAELHLAQADDQEEMESLEEDMDRARRHIRGREPGATRHRPRGSSSPRQRIEPPRAATIDGHGKAYYLVWGIVDWSIAGGMWYGAAVFTIYTLAAAGLTASGDLGRDAWLGSAGLGVIAIGLGGGGGIVAWRAGVNIGTFRQLNAR